MRRTKILILLGVFGCDPALREPVSAEMPCGPATSLAPWRGGTISVSSGTPYLQEDISAVYSSGDRRGVLEFRIGDATPTRAVLSFECCSAWTSYEMPAETHLIGVYAGDGAVELGDYDIVTAPSGSVTVDVNDTYHPRMEIDLTEAAAAIATGWLGVRFEVETPSDQYGTSFHNFELALEPGVPRTCVAPPDVEPGGDAALLSSRQLAVSLDAVPLAADADIVLRFGVLPTGRRAAGVWVNGPQQTLLDVTFSDGLVEGALPYERDVWTTIEATLHLATNTIDLVANGCSTVVPASVPGASAGPVLSLNASLFTSGGKGDIFLDDVSVFLRQDGVETRLFHDDFENGSDRWDVDTSDPPVLYAPPVCLP